MSISKFNQQRIFDLNSFNNGFKFEQKLKRGKTLQIFYIFI